MLEGTLCCSAHCKGHFICDEDQKCKSFCVTGAVFGDVGASLFVASAAFCEILRESRSANRCISFYTKNASPKGRQLRSPGCQMTILCSDHARIIVESSLDRRKQFTERSADILNHELRISWQAQYLVRSLLALPHCKWRFICDEDESRKSFCVWGAVYLVRFESDFSCSAQCSWHVNCDEGSVILRDRRNIWWYWRAHFVAPRIVKDILWRGSIMKVILCDRPVFGEVGGWVLFHMWRGSIMKVILCDRRSIWWRWRAHSVARRVVNHRCDADPSWVFFVIQSSTGVVLFSTLEYGIVLE